jgi:hypothetical protein
MTNVEDRVERALRALAGGVQPDVAAARRRLGERAGSTSPRKSRGPRPRVWVTLAAATVAVVGVGSLWAVGTRPQRPAAGTQPAASQPTPTAPASTAPVEPTTTIAATRPEIPTPERLAVLDPQPGVAPIRSDPVLDWVHATATSVPRRWFIRRAADGTPSGGVSMSDSPAMEWVRTFGTAPLAGISGVDARIVVDPGGAAVGWPVGDGVRVVAGVGNVDRDEAVAIARLAASADQLADVAVPEEFEEVAVPVDQGSVLYEDTQVTIGFAIVDQDAPPDAQAAAFMAAGRDGPVSRVPGEDAWLTTTYEGHPTAIVAVGTDAIATVVGMPGTDVASLVPALALVPARQVTVANPEATHGIPANAQKTYGEIDRGRWVVYQYTTTDGYDCISIDASWGGSGDCTPSGERDCPVADLIGGRNHPSGFEVFVPYLVDDLQVTIGGEPAEMTVERAEGFTFAYGPAPAAGGPIEVLVGGQPVC